jgi:hypothetical protein
MDTVLSRSEATNWDIRQGPVEGSRAGTSAWVERFPVLTLGLALTTQREFLDQVASIRAGANPEQIARRYIRRNQGRRLELITALLERAAEVPDDTMEQRRTRRRAMTAGANAYVEDGVPGPAAPQRSLRWDALRTLEIGAIRIARRGAGRCVAYDCPTDGGTVLAHDGLARDYCAGCEVRVPPSLKRSGGEAERVLFDGAVPVVLGVPSRSRARRQRRRN